MKIGIFTDTYYPQINGVTVTLENFSKEMRKMGHTVYIYAPKMRGVFKDNEYVIRIPSFKIINAESDVRMPLFIPDKSIMKIIKGDFDVIHAYGNGPFSLLGLQVARMKGKPFVMSFDTQLTKYMHYVLNGKVFKPVVAAQFLKIFASFCDGIATPSEKMKLELRKYGVKKDVLVIPNFVDIDKFSTSKENFLHQKLNIPETDLIVLSVGRLGREKNFAFLIKSFVHVLKESENAHLVIVGQGLEKKNLEKLVTKLELTGKVHLPGAVDPSEMPNVYGSSDVFAFASTSETQGLVVLEAAAAGLPVVLVDDSAFKNIIVSGENGFAVSLNIKKFADSIIELLNNPKLREKMGERSKILVKENFDKGVIVEALIDLYRGVLSDHKPIRMNVDGIKKMLDKFLPN